MDVAALHRRYVLTPWSAQAGLDMPAIEWGSGSYLYDVDGKRYLDLSAGLVAVNLGHGHPELASAIGDQAARLTYASPQFFNATRARYAERLSHHGPWTEGARSFFTTGGGEANEDAIKMARTITGRHKVLAAYRSFHGSAPGAGTLTGENRRWPNEPGIPGVVHFFAPNPYRSPFHTSEPAVEVARAIEHLELVLTYENPKAVSALIVEPVVGTNGAICYPDGYLAALRELCTRHGIVLIFDEVMCGFGRTGASFASVRYGIEPDMLTFAKGATSAYVPFGGVMVRESLAQYFDEHPLPCGHTFSGHPLAIAAASAALDIYESENIFDRARELEAWIAQGLQRLSERSAWIGDARGIGGFWAIELVKDRATREPIGPWQSADPGPLPGFLRDLRKRGVYAFGRYNIILITPPLTIERPELDEGLDALGAALEAFTCK
jgi:taurine--2-oxoglutarate transaminase